MKCHDKGDFCRSQEEINAFLKDKFILLYYNEIRFGGQFDGEEPIVKESSRLKWLPINTQAQQTLPLQISVTELTSENRAVALGESKEYRSNSEAFRLDEMIPRAYEKDDFTQVDITVEVNLD